MYTSLRGAHPRRRPERRPRAAAGRPAHRRRAARRVLMPSPRRAALTTALTLLMTRRRQRSPERRRADAAGRPTARPPSSLARSGPRRPDGRLQGLVQGRLPGRPAGQGGPRLPDRPDALRRRAPTRQQLRGDPARSSTRMAAGYSVRGRPGDDDGLRPHPPRQPRALLRPPHRRLPEARLRRRRTSSASRAAP